MRPLTVPLCLLVLMVLYVHHGDTQTITYKAKGASLPRPIYLKLFFAYKLISNQSVLLDYEGTGSGSGRAAIRDEPDKWDFVASDSPFSSGLPGLVDDYVLPFPLLGSAVSPVFNIPGYDGRLVLTPDLLYGIFSGNINKWDHPDIIALNPDIEGLVTNQTIIVCARTESSGTTSIFTGGMSNLSSSWKDEYGTFSVWPGSLLALDNFVDVGSGNTGVSIYIEETSYSIGYVPVSFIKNFLIELVDIKLSDKVISGTSEFLADVELDEYLEGNLIGYPEWPMVSLTYLAVNSKRNTSCDEFRDLIQIFLWASKRQQDIKDEGYVPISESVRDQVEAKLLTLSCNGEVLVSYEYLTNYLVPSTLFLVAALIIGVVHFCVFMLMLKYIDTAIEISTHLSLLVGTEIMTIGCIFWYLEPISDIICELRLWTTTTGLMILFSVSLSKGWQLVAIQTTPLKGKIDNHSIFYGSVSFTVLLQMVFLVLWTIVDPYSNYLRTVDEIALQLENTCTSSSISVWIGIQFVMIIILTLWGLFSTYYTWRLTKHYDPRFNLFTLYLCGVLLLGALFLISIVTLESQLYFVMSGASVLVTLGFLLPHYVQFIKIRRTLTKKSRTATNGVSAHVK
eukprot:TRINITY_DN3107_c0_g1_i1.p1 TRINITY_DN3107_c0_g1~~TRINITY_DN3107_c0_g1_i1.p1  ORF type:complete len:639 (+),score=92.43 TRINITY_DN3107_c0_g1_i1:52-1917(+)